MEKIYPPQDRLVRFPEVIHRTGRSRASIYRDMAQGKFPAAMKIGERAIAWRDSDLTAWLENLATAS